MAASCNGSGRNQRRDPVTGSQRRGYRRGDTRIPRSSRSAQPRAVRGNKPGIGGRRPRRPLQPAPRIPQRMGARFRHDCSCAEDSASARIRAAPIWNGKSCWRCCSAHARSAFRPAPNWYRRSASGKTSSPPRASTELSFRTSEAERPADYWTYAKGRGFTLLPGKSLIAALKKATQPDASGIRYGFSCYRASEYVILLGVAQELMVCNPNLLARLQRHWESRAIMSGEFHQVFLREHGSMTEPLPLKYYVPGDRVWFRNPDAHSSDASGYEGSWVLYLGNGLFNNFWQSTQPYTLTSKCLEIYHWRNATFRDAAGDLRMDEALVEQHVRESIADPVETQRIMREMLRHREPSGVYRMAAASTPPANICAGCAPTPRTCCCPNLKTDRASGKIFRVRRAVRDASRFSGVGPAPQRYCGSCYFPQPSNSAKRRPPIHPLFLLAIFSCSEPATPPCLRVDARYPLHPPRER